MVIVFLLFCINFIISLRPFNFRLGNVGKGPLAGRYPFTFAYGFLFALGRIGRLAASLIILPSCSEISGYENRTPRGFFNANKFAVLLG